MAASNSPSTSSPSTAPGAASPWLHGPAADLLLGAGLAYVASVPLLLLAARRWDLADWPVNSAALLVLAFNVPHYGATILRAYDQRADRRRYAIFTVWATIALAVLFVAGLHYALLGSLLVTLYWSWSPWHFAGQNYGLSLMFLRRRGIDVDPLSKRLLYASFGLSFVLTLLVVHVSETNAPVWARSTGEGAAFSFLSLNLPYAAVRVAAPLVLAAYAGCLAAAFARLGRGRRIVELAPVACLALTHALWFVLPAALLVFTQKLPALIFTVIWISAAHSVQYLWVSSYFAKREAPSLRLSRYFGRTLVAGAAVTWFPGLLFAPGLLGSVPWNEGLGILLFSVVNLHHFVLDGAIWKLRDGRVARALLRSPGSDEPAPEPVRPERSWLRPLLVAAGVVAVAVAVGDVWEREFGIRRAPGDLVRNRQAADRLVWLGRAAPRLHAQIGAMLATRGELEESVTEFERSLDLYPTAQAWFGLGVVRAAQGRWPESRIALDEALARNPDDVNALLHSARTWIRLDRPERAVAELTRARRLAPDNAVVRSELERTLARADGPAP